MTAPARGWVTSALAVLAAISLLVAVPGPAAAQPGATPSTTTDEQETPLLRDVLDATGRGYLKAKAAVEKSRKRQLQLTLELQKAQARLDELSPQVAQIAAQSYRAGKLTAISMLLNSSSDDSFMKRAVVLDEINVVNDHKLNALNEAREQAARAKNALDAELKEQQKQLTIMAKQKNEAERALALVGGKSLTLGGLVSATSPVARPAPRTADGDWPNESCNQNDPTTSGCITPRTLHMYKETKRAGFNRFVGCYRSGGPYEHPKGRACDWSLRNSGFSPASTSDQRLYGNNLAAFYVRNADRLGILYVIWYRKIWFPATGWRSYSGASNHTDHVHVSML
jgi:peptidoglycan DL-endopeptidase CwlO